MKDSWNRIALLSLVLVLGIAWLPAMAHDQTRKSFFKSQQRRLARAQQLQATAAEATCQVKIQLVDADSGRSLAGLLRVTDLSRNEALHLPELIQREQDWYATAANGLVKLPQKRLKLEVLHGITTRKVEQLLDLRGLDKRTLKISLQRFYDPAARKLVSGNTHLHLMRLTHAEAHRYLSTVPEADNLDLVFLSHLRRLPDERDYISNQFTDADLKRLSQQRVLFGNGEEHRHNFGRGGEGYGHVMLLDLVKLIRPVSIGPGIMRSGTDGLPLQRGIQTAHKDGATVIWCHNTFGFEDIPNWLGGLLDAQNIFDGGSHGSYEDSFYRYLNLGLRVPFSTGTDWFIYDFNRVYVPVEGKLTVKKWLQSLAQGRSYITNGPLLEFQIGQSSAGDTIRQDQPGPLRITARAVGRADFGQLQLVHNGKVIHTQAGVHKEGHFQAEFKISADASQSGWLAVRVAGSKAKNALGHPPFAHTSPIYVEVAGKPVFAPEIARELIKEIRQGLETIEAKGTFANEEERNRVFKVYQQGIRDLEQRLKDHLAPNRR
jgi:hypothetical protein